MHDFIIPHCSIGYPIVHGGVYFSPPMAGNVTYSPVHMQQGYYGYPVAFGEIIIMSL